MRTIVRFKLLAAIALLAVACDRTSELSWQGSPERLCSIASLKSRCTQQSVRITEDILVRGIVTANDRYGEFSNTLILEDATGGISVAVEHQRLYADFPFGAEVMLSCNGLTLCDYGGKIELGTTPGQYGAGRIPGREIGRYIRRTDSGDTALEATQLGFSDISADRIDTYVCFEGVHFTQRGCWCDTDPETGAPVTTEHQIADAAGRTFTVRVASTCSYATEIRPMETGRIKGIIDYFGGKYTLRTTNRNLFIATGEPPTAYP